MKQVKCPGCGTEYSTPQSENQEEASRQEG